MPAAPARALPSLARPYPPTPRRIPDGSRLFGLPEIPKMLRDPIGWGRDRYDRYGPVSWGSFLGQRVLIMLGPDANEFVLMNRGNVFSSKLGWNYYIEPYFRRGIMLRDFDEHRAHRRIMQSAFQREALARYLEQMNPDIDRLIERWQPQRGRRIVPVFPTVKQLTLDLASGIFLGEELGSVADKLNKAFVDAVRGGGAIVRYPLPGNLMWKGIRGRRVLEDYFYSKLPEKRKAVGSDFFSQFCHAESEYGERFDDRDIVDHMIFLLMAAHDTTTITMTTMFYQLARHPEWQERCRQEVLALDKPWLDLDDLPRLETLERVMKESLRMIAPVPGLPRVAVQDTEFNGFRIPRGTMVNIMLTFTHHMEEWWPDHRRFDPDRFLPERAEDKQHKFIYVPFGGGVHKCLGMHFADLQVKAVLNQVLRRYRWSVPRGYRMNVDNTSLPKPTDNLPVLMERIV